MKKHLFYLIVFAVSLCCTMAGSSEARVIHVDPYAHFEADGSSWYYPLLSIHSAVQAATSGDEIWVMKGRYGGVSG